mgnify:FL=1
MILAVITAEGIIAGVIVLATLFMLILMMYWIWSELKDEATIYSTRYLWFMFWMLPLSVVVWAVQGVLLLMQI